MTTVDLPLLPLGRGSDPASERGVECPGDLPAASEPRPGAPGPGRERSARRPGLRARHHYQRDKVIQFAEVTGNSFKLWGNAAARAEGGIHRLLGGGTSWPNPPNT